MSKTKALFLKTKMNQHYVKQKKQRSEEEMK
jgi:hypothetical protein